MQLALDTNVVSELAKPDCNEQVFAWSQTLRSQDLFLPSPCWAELQRGVHLLPAGRRRDRITASLESLIGSLGGIVAFGRAEAQIYAELTSQPGRPRPPIDAMIAAICRTHELALATRNTRGFDDCGIDLVSPWQYVSRSWDHAQTG